MLKNEIISNKQQNTPTKQTMFLSEINSFLLFSSQSGNSFQSIYLTFRN